MMQDGDAWSRFQIRRPLGQGGMADVYLAQDVEQGREVALKIFRQGAAAPQAQESELQGARIQRLLAQSVSEVPTVYELGFHEGVAWISMEVVQGLELSQILAHSPLGEAQAVRLGKSLGSLLDRMHHFRSHLDGREVLGVVHGDLKPENIRIERQRLRLLDFGSAVALYPGQQNRSLEASTAYYVPPEFRSGDEVDAGLDLWAAAVIVYQMVCGRLPFPGVERVDVLRSIRSGPARDFAAGCSEPMRRFLRAALHRDPRRRPRDAREFVSRLAQTQAGGPQGLPTRPLTNEDLYSECLALQHPSGLPTAPAEEATDASALPPPVWPKVPRPPKPATVVSKPVPEGDTSTSGAGKRTWSWRGTGRGQLAAGLLILFLLSQIAVFAGATILESRMEQSDGDPLESWGTYRVLSSFSLGDLPLAPVQNEIVSGLRGRVDALLGDLRLPKVGDDLSHARWLEACEYLSALRSVRPGSVRDRARLQYCHAAADYVSATAGLDLEVASVPPQTIEQILDGLQRAAITDPSWPLPHVAMAQVHTLLAFDFDQVTRLLEQAKSLGHTPTSEDTAVEGVAFGKACEVGYREAQDVRGTSGEGAALRQVQTLCQEALARLSTGGTSGLQSVVSMHLRGLHHRLQLLERSFP